MKRIILSLVAILAVSSAFVGCDKLKGNKDEELVRDFGVKFGEMIQNKDEKGVKAVYSEAGNIENTHLVFHRDDIDIFPEEDGKYKIRYDDGAYIIVKKGLNDAFEVVSSHGIYGENKKVAGPVEVAPLHKNKKSTPGYLPDYDWLSSYKVTYSDIAGKSGSELRVMRNYIYARHGYKFKSKDLQQYFAQYPWYTPLYNDVSGSLNSVEKANVQFIRSYE